MEDPNNCSPPPLTFVRTTTTIGSTMDALTLHASFFEIAYELLKLPSRRLQTLWEWKKPRLRPSHPQAHSACKAQVPATHRLRPSHPQAQAEPPTGFEPSVTVWSIHALDRGAERWGTDGSSGTRRSTPAPPPCRPARWRWPGPRSARAIHWEQTCGHLRSVERCAALQHRQS